MRASTEPETVAHKQKLSSKSEEHAEYTGNKEGLTRPTLYIAMGVSGGIWTLIFFLLNFNRFAIFCAAITIFAPLMLMFSLNLQSRRLKPALKSEPEN